MDFLGGMNFMTRVRVVTENKKLNFQQFWLILGGVANISVQISFKELIFCKFFFLETDFEEA